jgi:hypothetical protein
MKRENLKNHFEDKHSQEENEVHMNNLLIIDEISNTILMKLLEHIRKCFIIFVSSEKRGI